MFTLDEQELLDFRVTLLDFMVQVYLQTVESFVIYQEQIGHLHFKIIELPLMYYNHYQHRITKNLGCDKEVEPYQL